MITLNFENADDYIFSRKEVRALFPEFHNLFSSWDLASRNSALRQLGNRCVLDVLSRINQERLEKLSEFFGEKVSVQKINHNSVENYKTDIEKIEMTLNQGNIFPNFAITRNGKEISLTTWR